MRVAAASEDPAVLLVEDDQDTQLFMTAILERIAKVPVLRAASAAEARKQLAHHRAEIAAMILDVSLKGDEDGLSLARSLRSAGEHLPIIVVTAHDLEREARSPNARCDAFLPKPVNTRELVRVVRSHVSAARAAS